MRRLYRLFPEWSRATVSTLPPETPPLYGALEGVGMPRVVVINQAVDRNVVNVCSFNIFYLYKLFSLIGIVIVISLNTLFAYC